MSFRLRSLLTALLDRNASNRALRLAWIIAIVWLFITLGAIAALAYGIWIYWPTLLFSDVFSGSLWSALIPWIYVLRLPLELSRLSRTLSTDSTMLAYALRHALESNDTAIAPLASNETTPAAPESGSFAPPAMVTRDTLTLAIPTPLIVSRAPAFISNLLGVTMLGGCALTVVITTGTLNLPVQQLLTAAPSDIIVPATICGALLLCALVFFVLGARFQRRRSLMRRGLSLAVDSLGIAFHQPAWAKKPTSITWAEMRALAQFTYRDTHTRTHLVYLLDSEQRTLLWEFPPDEPYGPPQVRTSIASQQECSRTLARLITSHTRLPLHDLSETVAQLVGDNTSNANTGGVSFLRRAYSLALGEKDVATATALWQASEPGARLPRALRKLVESPRVSHAVDDNTPTTSHSSSPTTPASPTTTRFVARISALMESAVAKHRATMAMARFLIPHLPTTEHAATPPRIQRYVRSIHLQRMLTAGLLWTHILLLASIFVGGGIFWLGERQVDSMIGNVPQQIQLETPIYFAPLTSAEPDWTTAEPTKTDQTSAQFVHGSYELSTKDTTASALTWTLTESPDDLVLSTAVTIHGSVDKGGTSTAGMLFDVAGDGNTFSAFGVDESGNWTLFNFDSRIDPNNAWQSVDSGSSSAINEGDGATNTLMVVRHGPLYLLYVNNVLMDRFYDKSHALTPGGYIGAYIDSSDIRADFNYVTMYPVPAQLAALPLTDDYPLWLK